MSELTIEPLDKLRRDLRAAARTLTEHEARYLVDAYYQLQRDRIRAAHQARQAGEQAEPHEVIRWLEGNTATLERNIRSALDAYTDAQPVGQWSKSICGIGPVLSAGLLAHIDITRAPTVGHIWRFAGLDPTVLLGAEDEAALECGAEGPVLEDRGVVRESVGERQRRLREGVCGPQGPRAGAERARAVCGSGGGGAGDEALAGRHDGESGL